MAKRNLTTEPRIRDAKPGKRLNDGDGLKLVKNDDGTAKILFRYLRPITRRENMLSLGRWPDVSLDLARERRDEARKQLAQGKDPADVRKAEALATALAAADTFEAVAREWLETKKGVGKGKLAPVTIAKAEWMLETFLYPEIGKAPIRELKASDLRAALRKVEKKGFVHTAHRCKWRCGQIFRYAVLENRAERDITPELKGVLTPDETEHRPAITEPAKIGELLRAIDAYQGQPSAKFALMLSPHVFLRPDELRKGEWAEIDLDAAEWRVPAARMKMKVPHLVPLSRQVVGLLRELRTHVGYSPYLFPSLRSKDRYISSNTLNAALRRLGYDKTQMVAHGFRTLASTSLNELGFNGDLIELQLAHSTGERDDIRDDYNRATHVARRTKMMQAWSDYLDGLRADERGNVVALRA